MRLSVALDAFLFVPGDGPMAAMASPFYTEAARITGILRAVDSVCEPRNRESVL